MRKCGQIAGRRLRYHLHQLLGNKLKVKLNCNDQFSEAFLLLNVNCRSLRWDRGDKSVNGDLGRKNVVAGSWETEERK